MAIIEVDTETPRQLQVVADILATAKKVVVITGAGISTNCGIPDFRSPNGLYSLISSEYNDRLSSSFKSQNKISGKDLFDATLWRDEQCTSVFYTFIASLRRKIREEVKKSSPTHKFIRHLRDKQKLVRCYTQNIDGLETRNGLCVDLSEGKGDKSRFTKKTLSQNMGLRKFSSDSVRNGGCEVVQLHGDLSSLRCSLCSITCSWDDEGREARFLRGEAPLCPQCNLQDKERRDRGRRGIAVGNLRPNIVLYGEEHPQADLLASITRYDLGLALDVLLILGTSLKVHGLKILVKEFAKAVHGKKGPKRKVIFVNLSKPPSSIWNDVIDYWVEMDCDEWVRDLRVRRPDIWQSQGHLSSRVLKDHPAGSRQPAMTVGRKKGVGDKENLKPAPLTLRRQAETRRPLSVVTVNSARAHEPKGTSAMAPKTTTKPPARPEQLPTPPSTGHRMEKTTNKRSILQVAQGDLTPPPTPSKRRKGDVQIWHDEEDDSQRLPEFSLPLPTSTDSATVSVRVSKSRLMTSVPPISRSKRRQILGQQGD